MLFTRQRNGAKPKPKNQLWTPSGLHKELEGLVAGWKETSAYTQEEQVALFLAKVSHTVIAKEKASSANTRASDAIKGQVGNCVAHTEATVGFGITHGLSMTGHWSGCHAATLWLTEDRVWFISPYSEAASIWMASYENETLLEQARVAVSQALTENTAMTYIVELYSELPKIEARAISQTDSVNVMQLYGDGLIAPPEPMLQFLLANS